ncbi:MAG: hypothetical protein ACYDGR_03750 [Candidatus Dormibacteria bacterium]
MSRVLGAGILATVLALPQVTSAAGAGALASYAGDAHAQALSLQVAPSALLNVDLSAVQQALGQLPGGAGAALAGALGTTLSDVATPVTLEVNSNSVSGVSGAGSDLTGGNGSTASVRLNAAALQTQVARLSATLANLPTAAVATLQAALAPLVAADTTGKLQAAFSTVQATLGTPIADTLLAPPANLTRSAVASFGQDWHGSTVSVDSSGALGSGTNPQAAPWAARALPAGALASSTLLNLDVSPGLGGTVAVPDINGALTTSLSNLQAALATVESTLAGVVATIPVVGPTVGGTVGTITGVVAGAPSGLPALPAAPVLPTLSSHLVAGVTAPVITVGGQTVDLNQLSTLVNQVAALRGNLGALNGMALNDAATVNAASSMASVHPSASGAASGSAMSVMNVSLLTLKNPALVALLKQVTGMDFSGMPTVSIDALRAAASLQMDGINAPIATAEGHFADIKVLGRVVSTDAILQPGSSCVVSIPGASTCPGVATIADATGGVVGTLLTVTLARGKAALPTSNTPVSASAAITTLNVSVDINLDALRRLTPGGTPLVNLAQGAGTSRLVNLAAGVAAANLVVTPQSASTTSNPTVPAAAAPAAPAAQTAACTSPCATLPNTSAAEVGGTNSLLVLMFWMVAGLFVGVAGRRARGHTG